MVRDGELKVLLIESDAQTIQAFLEIMATFPTHLRIKIACQPIEVLRQMRSTTFDVLLCDPFMGHGELLQFLMGICSEHPITPVLLITGDPTVSLENLPLCTGSSCIRSVVHKPLNIQEVHQKMQEAVDYLKAR